MIKDIPISERPKEKLLRFGANHLTDSELIANVIRTGAKDLSVVELSRALMKHCDGDLTNLSQLVFEELILIKGIGETKACQLLATLEIGRRVYLGRDLIGYKMNTPAAVAEFFYGLVGECQVEKFMVAFLNCKGIVTGYNEVSSGILNSTLVHPREVFRPAIKKSASSIIAVHNHPSGDVTPSQEDIALTDRLYKASRVLGIDLNDHLVISKHSYHSIRESHPHIWGNK